MPLKKGNIPWNKGLTKETDKRLRKLSEKMKGRTITEEHKKNLSESHKGQIAWNKGLTKETDERIKSSWNRGLTKEIDERVKKTSEAKKGKPSHWKGKTHTEESRKKMRKAKEGFVPWNKGLTKETDERLRIFGEKMSEIEKGENNPNWNPNREKVYAPYGENFRNQKIRNDKWDLQNGRDMLTGTKLYPDKRNDYHHIDYDKSNDDPDNHCYLSMSNHARITGNQQNPIKSEKYKKILQENTLALKNGEIPKKWSPLNKELFRQEKLKQLDLISYII